MKSRQKNRSMGFILAATVAMLVMCISATVYADGTIGVSNGFKETIIYSKTDKERGCMFYLESFPDKVTQMKAVSSKKSVATVEINGDKNFTVIPKKPGTTKITVTGKKGKKKVKCTGTIEVVKFQKPLSVLKVNGKSCLGSVKSSSDAMALYTDKSSVKLNFKVASGWKIVYSFVSYGNTTEKPKNGKSYSLGKGGHVSVYMELMNKKNGATIKTSMYITRQPDKQPVSF